MGNVQIMKRNESQKLYCTTTEYGRKMEVKKTGWIQVVGKDLKRIGVRNWICWKQSWVETNVA